MSILSNFEDGIAGLFEGAAGSLFRSPVEPVQIVRVAEKEMVKNKLVGPGKAYAPTLYTVLLSPADDKNLASFYPTLSSECGTYLVGKASEANLFLTTKPFVRFMVDEGLKSGKFAVIAENVSAEELAEIRNEEEDFWGVSSYGQPRSPKASGFGGGARAAAGDIGGGVSPAGGPAGAGLGGRGIPGIDFEDTDFAAPSSTPGACGTSEAHLVDLKTGRSYPLSMRTTIGRDPRSGIVVEDVNVSRNHATLECQGGRWVLTDLGSTNGTQVDGRRITSATLREGDEVTFGVTRYQFREG